MLISMIELRRTIMIDLRIAWLFLLSYIFRKKEFKVGTTFTTDTIGVLPPISDETLAKIKASHEEVEEPQTLFFMNKKNGMMYRYAYSHTSPSGLFLHALQSKNKDIELHVSSKILTKYFFQLTTDENISCL